MKLRILKRTTTRHFMQNNGSRRYPEIVDCSEETKEELLQFRQDDTQEWQDVEVEFEHVEYNTD